MSENRSITVRRMKAGSLPAQWRGRDGGGEEDLSVYVYRTEADWTVPGACCRIADREYTVLYFEEKGDE